MITESKIEGHKVKRSFSWKFGEKYESNEENGKMKSGLLDSRAWLVAIIMKVSACSKPTQKETLYYACSENTTSPTFIESDLSIPPSCQYMLACRY